MTVVAFLMGALLLVNDVKRSNTEQSQICRVAQRDNQTLRSLILLASANSEVRLKAYPERLRVSRAFYRAALLILKPVDCDHL